MKFEIKSKQVVFKSDKNNTSNDLVLIGEFDFL